MSPEMLHGNDGDNPAEYIGGIIKRISNFDPERFTDELNERKKFQKTVYLIQAYRIDLGYDFSWYLHGPYSPDLADVGYELAEIYDEVEETKFSDPGIEEQFRHFLDFIEPLKDDVQMLEISASLHFLKQRNPGLNKDPLIEFLLSEKDSLDGTFDDCLDEWMYLEDHELV